MPIFPASKAKFKVRPGANLAYRFSYRIEMNMTMKSSILFLGLMIMLSSIAYTQEQDDAAADDETVYIVQPKPMILRNRFEIIGQAAHDLADRYVSQSGVSAQLIYHVRENFALALHGTWMFWQGNSSITENLGALRDANNNSVLTPDG